MPYDFTRTLTPYTLPQRSRRAYRALVLHLDTEGRMLDGLSANEGATHEVTYYQDRAAFFHQLLRSEGASVVWFLHSLSGREMTALLEGLTECLSAYPGLRVDVVSQGRERIIGAVLHRGHRTWQIRNSAAVLPLPAAELVRAFAPHATTPDSAPALVAALVGLDVLLHDTFRVPLGWTPGATALKAWRATLPQQTAYLRQRPTVERFCRDGYYGGLTYLSTTAIQRDTVTLDVNSMYPYVMRRYGVPVGPVCYVDQRVLDRPAFYRVRATVPRQTVCPVLPYRTGGVVTYPTGSFETVATSDELSAAERQGARCQVIEGYLFRRIVYPFQNFVTYCEQIRRIWHDAPQERLAKLLQASLYGKFGARPTIERYALLSTPPADYQTWRPMVNEQTGEILPYLYSSIEPLERPYLHPEWAAWITAQARLLLLRVMHAIGIREIVYADTDSITASRRALGHALARGAVTIGPEYGQFKIEREYQWFRAGQAKHYQGQLTDGRMLDKAAGIMRDAVVSSEHTRALDGEHVRVEGTITPGGLQVLRGQASQAQQQARSYPQGRANQQVRPPHMTDMTDDREEAEDDGG